MIDWWSELGALIRRELAGYFATPVAYVFLAVFLALAAAMPFYLAGFFEREIADLQPFFGFHPWLYLFLVPAVGMRLWAEEFRSGTVELLLSLPVGGWQVVLGKFLAAWLFLGLALLLTFPIWITVNVLGSPDNGVIVAAYLGSWLMAGGFLAISATLSATTSNQVVAFILAVLVCLLLLLIGLPAVLDPLRGLLGQGVIDGLAQLSFLIRYDAISRGVLELADVAYFVWLMALALTANYLILMHRVQR